MYNLEKSIGEWRKGMRVRGITGEALAELENHLRDHVAELVRSGVPEKEALDRAVARLGSAPPIAAEFRKLDQGTWLPVKVAVWFGVAAALVCAVLMVVALSTGRIGPLLASHVLTVTLGYGATFLIGALGICFVAQRSFGEVKRLRGVTRVTFALGCVAAAMTVAGVLLGGVWAKGAWGRFWGWDVKEVGGLAVVLWQFAFLFAHRFASSSRLLVLSILGNVVVGLAWFGSNLIVERPAAFGMYAALVVGAALANCVVFCVGLAPAGWVRAKGN